MFLPLTSFRAIAVSPIAAGVLCVSTLEAQGGSFPPPKHIAMPDRVEVELFGATARDTRPAVDVMINGKGPYRFLVETGSRAIRVSAEIAEQIGLARATDGVGDYHADSMNIGRASFKDVQLAALPPGLSGMSKAQGTAGFLGLPFYQNVLLTIDYPAKRLRFERDTLAAANGLDILPLVMVNDYYWGMPITIGGRAFTSVLDTQNASAMGMAVEIADGMAFDVEPTPYGAARGAFGSMPITVGQLKDDVRIGRYGFARLPVMVTQLPPGFPKGTNVGTGMLSNFAVSLDQRHARLRLARSESGPIVVPMPPPRPQPGVPPAWDPSTSRR